MDYSRLKLVIWDLDETFWRGTLSEGSVEKLVENINLLKILDDRGIINSICSKNDEFLVMNKLEEMGVIDYFVFCSIDWSPKGERIRRTLQEMGLRPVNCLFIDDNPVNRHEALHYVNGLNVATPEEIPNILSYFDRIDITDPGHNRRSHYRILEAKSKARKVSSDNYQFLMQSETMVDIHHDCLAHIDRITEMVNRTNQLNYTKLRVSPEEIALLCSDATVNTGYVTVSDKYGDYGIVGFFAVRDGRCIHFLFSCRIIGQGVEQYVYSMLGYPVLETVGEVINPVNSDPPPIWINKGRSTNVASLAPLKKRGRVLLKGGCDLKIMSEYISANNIIEEFSYIGKKNNNIEHINHSVNYLTFPFYSRDDRARALSEYIFNDENMFDSAMYSDDVDILFISTLSEPNLGVYKNLESGKCFAWGEYRFPLTDSSIWPKYINNECFTANNTFTEDWLKKFSEKHVFLGRLTPDQILENARQLLSKTNPKMKICFILGSETPYDINKQENYVGREKDYRDINMRMRSLAAGNDRVLLIDLNNYIRSQDDFTNNINHFKRRVYYLMALQANKYINDVVGTTVKQKSRLYLFYKSLIDDLGYRGFYQTRAWSMLRKPYVLIKRIFSH